MSLFKQRETANFIRLSDEKDIKLLTYIITTLVTPSIDSAFDYHIITTMEEINKKAI